MCQTLANEQIDDSIRMSAGLMLKNGVSSKEEARREEQARRWLSMVDDNTRNQVKQGVRISLLSLLLFATHLSPTKKGSFC